MVSLLVEWLLSALALWMVAQVLSGIELKGYGTALIATIVIAIVNTLIGWPLRILTFPLTVVTLGVFWLILNAFLLKLASIFVPGFRIHGFLPAFFGSIALTIVHYILRHLLFSPRGWLYPHGRYY
jgi:putative membrane protein